MASSHYRITSLDLPTCQEGEIQKNRTKILKAMIFKILDKGQYKGCDHQHKGSKLHKAYGAVEAFTGCSAGKRPSLGGGLDELGDRSQSLGRLRYLEFSDKNNKEKGSNSEEFQKAKIGSP